MVKIVTIPMDNALDYSWTQTSGQGVDLEDSNDPQARFWAPYVYNDETLKFTLRVQDPEGNSDEELYFCKSKFGCRFK